MNAEEIYRFFSLLNAKIHRVGLWVIVLLLIGACIGAWGMMQYQKSNINDWIRLQGFIHSETGDVYMVKWDPVRNAGKTQPQPVQQ